MAGPFVRQAIRTSDGGFAITGGGDDGSQSLFFVVKTTSAGVLQWFKKYDPSSGSDDSYGIQQTSDGGFLVSGWTQGGPSFSNPFILKLNSSGTFTSSKTTSMADEAYYSIGKVNDGNFVMATSRGSNSGGLIKFNESGNTACTLNNLPPNEQSITNFNNDTGSYTPVNLTVANNTGSFTAQTYSTTTTTLCFNTSVEELGMAGSIKINPTLTSDGFFVELKPDVLGHPVNVKILSLEGAVLREKFVNDLSTWIECSDLSSGMYLIKVETSEVTKLDKLVVIGK
jgi:hypothetical protein